MLKILIETSLSKIFDVFVLVRSKKNIRPRQFQWRSLGQLNRKSQSKIFLPKKEGLSCLGTKSFAEVDYFQSKNIMIKKTFKNSVFNKIIHYICHRS